MLLEIPAMVLPKATVITYNYSSPRKAAVKPMFAPNASLKPSDVTEILDRLFDIRNGNPRKDSQTKIAKDFKVAPKTINRISTGKSWPGRRALHQPRVIVKAQPESIVNLHETLCRVKQVFAMSLNAPMHYGRFEWIDSMGMQEHYAVSDGCILWQSRSLFLLAMDTLQSEEAGSPFYAKAAKELCTFSLSQLFSEPLENHVRVYERLATGLVRLKNLAGDYIFIKERYLSLIERRHFDIYMGKGNYIFLTKTSESGDPIPNACLATITL
jgi:hypothetical protein